MSDDLAKDKRLYDFYINYAIIINDMIIVRWQ